MVAGIIAAGEGSRLKAEGIRTPKPLVRVNGVPIIERLLRSLHGCGISAVHCIVNEDSTIVRDYVQGLRLPFPVSFLVKSTPSSMHSLFELAPALGGAGRFLLTTVDSVFDEKDLKALVSAASGDRMADGLLAVTEYVDDENPLYVDADGNGKILSFSKTGNARWVTGGLYALSTRVFDEVEAARRAGIERLRHFLAHLVRTGYDLRIFPFSTIIDVDHVGDIRAAERMLGGR
jgi:NDP-sugar pyrophosphorylase family protein